MFAIFAKGLWKIKNRKTSYQTGKLVKFNQLSFLDKTQRFLF